MGGPGARKAGVQDAAKSRGVGLIRGYAGFDVTAAPEPTSRRLVQRLGTAIAGCCGRTSAGQIVRTRRSTLSAETRRSTSWRSDVTMASPRMAAPTTTTASITSAVRLLKGNSRIEDIDSGLVDLVRQVRALGIRSIAVPPLGSGNGGLDWDIVRPRIVHAFDSLPDVRVLLYEPRGEPPAHERPIGTEKPLLTVPRALYIALIGAYRRLDYALTLLELQKLAYFLQVAGEPLKLNFERAPYGPYAHNLNQVLRRLEGHYLAGATDTKPGTEIRLLDGAVKEASQFLEVKPAAHDRLDRVSRLIEGFETPYGMELLATVHLGCDGRPAGSWRCRRLPCGHTRVEFAQAAAHATRTCRSRLGETPRRRMGTFGTRLSVT
jgi:O-acetyl-ADP-ribose deacetylase (regulator of RNase III)